MQTDAVTIAPRRPRQTPYLDRNHDVRTRQSLPQNIELHLQLKGWARVLVLAPAASGNIFAAGYNTHRRGLKDRIELAGSEAAAVHSNRGLDQFAGQCPGNKNRLACGNARQPIAAID